MKPAGLGKAEVLVKMYAQCKTPNYLNWKLLRRACLETGIDTARYGKIIGSVIVMEIFPVLTIKY